MEKVLLTGNSNNSNLLLEESLQAAGFIVQTFASARAALEQYQAIAPNIIISSTETVDIDGYQFCDQLRRIDRLVPFILFSTISDEEHFRRGYSVGIDEFLIQPYNLSEVIAKLKNHIDRYYRIQSEIRRLVHLKPLSSRTFTLQSKQLKSREKLSLTATEDKVFQRTINGNSAKETASLLQISPRTVQNHLQNIYKKLGVNTRQQLLILALDKGLRPLEKSAEVFI